MDGLSYFWVVLKATLVSSSGLGNLPAIHQDFIARGWADETEFGRAVAIGQLSPGPSGLWVVALGYLTAGWLGVALTTLAVAVPPLLILVIAPFYTRFNSQPPVYGFIRGVCLGVAGVVTVALARVLLHNGLDVVSMAIVVLAASTAATRRVPPILVLAAAGVAGAVIYG